MVIDEFVTGGIKAIKGIDPLLLQNQTTIEKSESEVKTSEETPCNCGSKSDKSCTCSGNCGSECSCKNKKNLGTCLLKISIGLAILAAGYLLIKK